MEEIKERLDGILRYLVIGYPLMFLFIWIFFLSIDWIGDLAPKLLGGFLWDFMFFFSKFYYGDIASMVGIGKFPFASLSTLGILVVARYIISGKTYQK